MALNTALAELMPLHWVLLVLTRVDLCFTPPQADSLHPCLAAPPSHSCCFPCPSPLTCHWGKEGKHLLSCTSLLSPWVRSVGSSLWLCTARRFFRICLSSWWRSIAGIPDLLVFPPTPPRGNVQVLTGCVTCLGVALGGSCPSFLPDTQITFNSCIKTRGSAPSCCRTEGGLAALGPALGSCSHSGMHGLFWKSFICSLLVHPAPAQSP